jgi:hypothetical protein
MQVLPDEMKCRSEYFIPPHSEPDKLLIVEIENKREAFPKLEIHVCVLAKHFKWTDFEDIPLLTE